MGADGLGNTANLPGGGGGGGGGNTGGGGGGGGGRGGGGGGGGMSEFMVVLQDAAKPGTIVKKGQDIAEFDRQYMMTRLDDYKASVSQTEASFKKLTSDMELTKKTHEQTILSAQADYDKAVLDMKTLPVRSAMDSERLRLALEETQARLKQLKEEVKYVDASIKADRRVADLQVEMSRLELRRAENNVNRLVLKAPIDGMVVMQNTFRGSDFDQIKVGDQLFPGMMFMQVVDPNSMIVNANISQVDVEKVRLGMKAKMKFDAFPGLELPGHVMAIGSVAKSSRFRPDWVKEIPVRIKLDAMDPRVIPDISVSCDIILDEADAPAVLPREAVFTDRGADGKESKPYVWVRAMNNDWQRREVELGHANFTHVAVRNGVKPQEVVAVERPVSRKPDEEKQVS
ncbi:MAG: efflux RND transporter periplasmic adaptor subunit [Bryobacteraceae bacterium]